jgi:hypothetical protein
MTDLTNEKPREYSQEELNAGTLIFAQALQSVLPSGEGVLVKATGEIDGYFGPKDGLIIVANTGGQIQVIALDDVLDDTSGFTDGMLITIGEPDDEDKDEENIDIEIDGE